jgi:hypothetical protein
MENVIYLFITEYTYGIKLLGPQLVKNSLSTLVICLHSNYFYDDDNNIYDEKKSYKKNYTSVKKKKIKKYLVKEYGNDPHYFITQYKNCINDIEKALLYANVTNIKIIYKAKSLIKACTVGAIFEEQLIKYFIETFSKKINVIPTVQLVIDEYNYEIAKRFIMTYAKLCIIDAINVRKNVQDNKIIKMRLNLFDVKKIIINDQTYDVNFFMNFLSQFPNLKHLVLCNVIFVGSCSKVDQSITKINKLVLIDNSNNKKALPKSILKYFTMNTSLKQLILVGHTKKYVCEITESLIPVNLQLEAIKIVQKKYEQKPRTPLQLNTMIINNICSMQNLIYLNLSNFYASTLDIINILKQNNKIIECKLELFCDNDDNMTELMTTLSNSDITRLSLTHKYHPKNTSTELYKHLPILNNNASLTNLTINLFEGNEYVFSSITEKIGCLKNLQKIKIIDGLYRECSDVIPKIIETYSNNNNIRKIIYDSYKFDKLLEHSSNSTSVTILCEHNTKYITSIWMSISKLLSADTLKQLNNFVSTHKSLNYLRIGRQYVAIINRPLHTNNIVNVDANVDVIMIE